MELFGLYVGIVEKNTDPEKLGRVKVRVPHVYGVVGGTLGSVPVDDLPWALPSGLPAGGSDTSGGCSWLPDVGDQVAVQFLDGEPEKPVWMWLMQTIAQAQQLKLHQYQDGPSGTVGLPKRAAWTRYGHVAEWNDAGLIFTTQHGYRLLLTDGDDSDGEVMLSTGAGQYLSLDDSTNTATLNVTDDLYFQIGSELNVMCDSLRFEAVTGDVKMTVGDKFTLDLQGDLSVTGLADISMEAAEDMKLTASADLTLSATDNFRVQFDVLTLGLNSKEPYVLGNQLVLLLNSLYEWLTSHTHTNGNEGSPTGPPIIPPAGVVQPAPSLVISEVIFGQ